METILTIFPIILGVTMAARTLYVIYLRPHADPSDMVNLPNGIAVRDSGEMEREMQNLRRVIVGAVKLA